MKTNNFKKIVFKKGKIIKNEYNIQKFEEMVIDFNEIILTSGYQIKDSLPMGGEIDETI